MRQFFAIWGEFPTTQARVTMTLGCVLATALRYVVSGLWTATQWSPSYEWLGFLLLMSGVDALQYFGKRTTDTAYIAATMGVTPAPLPTDAATTR